MNVVKELSEELTKAESRDRFYLIKMTIGRMLAPQDPRYVRQYSYVKSGWGSIERIETRRDGSPQALRAPQRRRTTRKGESEEKTAGCWSFKTLKRHVLLPWGGSFGLFKASLRRSLAAQRRMSYHSAPLDLIKVYPLWLDVGESPCESMKGDAMPEVVLETRHTTRGDVMVEAFYDFVEDRETSFIVEVDGECPLNDEAFIALVKTLNNLDNIGPSKRGEVKIDDIKQVAVSPDEIEKLTLGEPTLPVIY